MMPTTLRDRIARWTRRRDPAAEVDAIAALA
jgi:hypothetical protein